MADSALKTTAPALLALLEAERAHLRVLRVAAEEARQESERQHQLVNDLAELVEDLENAYRRAGGKP